MQYIEQFFTELIGLTTAMSPYLLLGFLFAGILKVYFPQKWIDRYMGKNNFASSFNTALLGIPLPLCSCGVIPTGISFYRNGASKGSSVSFLISTPQTGVDSVLVTYSMLGLPFAIIRVVVALFTGVVGGVITNLFGEDKQADAHFQSQKRATTVTVQGHSLKRMLSYGFYEFLMDIAKWLIIGILLAAALAVIIPDDFFTLYLNNEPLSLLAVLVASVPLYLCATASVPIAAVLMLKGLSPGAALVLLMAGPATNAATITVIKKVFGNKTLFSYLGSIIGGALLFGLIINHLLPREWFTLAEHAMHHQHEHEMIPRWMEIGSALLLTGLIINGYVQRWRSNQKQKITTVSNAPNTLLAKPVVTNPASFSTMSFVKPDDKSSFIHLTVEGMTCNHCKASVEKNVSALPGINSVTATPSLNLVRISGKRIDLKEIEKTIEQLGYTYKGVVKS